MFKSQGTAGCLELNLNMLRSALIHETFRATRDAKGGLPSRKAWVNLAFETTVVIAQKWRRTNLKTAYNRSTIPSAKPAALGLLLLPARRVRYVAPPASTTETWIGQTIFQAQDSPSYSYPANNLWQKPTAATPM